jgi:hypothetical protein
VIEKASGKAKQLKTDDQHTGIFPYASSMQNWIFASSSITAHFFSTSSDFRAPLSPVLQLSLAGYWFANLTREYLDLYVRDTYISSILYGNIVYLPYMANRILSAAASLLTGRFSGIMPFTDFTSNLTGISILGKVPVTVRYTPPCRAPPVKRI